MTTRDDIIGTIRQHLEAVRAARLAEIQAAKPQLVVQHAPADYQQIASLLVDALMAFAPDLVQDVAEELSRQHPDGYPPEQHRHQWKEIDGGPATYPPARHRHEWTDIDDRPEAYPPEQHRHPDLETRMGEIATAPILWEAIQGKPSRYPPGLHAHPQDSDLLHLLEILYETGRPGEVLTRKRAGLEWKPVPINAFYYPAGGGGGGGGLVFAKFQGDVSAGHFAVVAGETEVTRAMSIKGVLVCL